MHSRTIAALMTSAMTVGCESCDPGGKENVIVNPVVTSIATSLTISGVSDLEAINARLTLVAQVKDQTGGIMSGQSVVWQSEQTGVVTVDASGGVTAVSNGIATIRATSGTVTNTATVSVIQRPTRLDLVSGNAQSGIVGAPLPADVVVRALDSLGTPVSGASIAFGVTSGGGSLNRTTTTSDVAGLANARWVLGTSITDAQRVRATLQARPAVTVDFSATPGPDAPILLKKSSGDGLTAPRSSVLPGQIVARVSDRFDNSVANVEIEFATGTNSGSVNPSRVFTASNGEVRTTWTLGTLLGTQTLTARGRTIALPQVVFVATATVAPNDSAQFGRRPR